MSYNSKKTLASLAAGLATGIAYVAHALGAAAPAPQDVQAWAATMLVFIGIGAAAVIAVQILFHIALAVHLTAKEKDEKTVKRVMGATMLEDERDKAVSRKSSAVGYGLAGLGFCAALVALAAGASVVLALHILFGASFLGSLLEGCASIYWYERGLQNG